MPSKYCNVFFVSAYNMLTIKEINYAKIIIYFNFFSSTQITLEDKVS